ncbi:MAG: hypothetical protein ACC742_17075 [Thermoanaerobaculales bacterium]
MWLHGHYAECERTMLTGELTAEGYRILVTCSKQLKPIFADIWTVFQPRSTGGSGRATLMALAGQRWRSPSSSSHDNTITLN